MNAFLTEITKRSKTFSKVIKRELLLLGGTTEDLDLIVEQIRHEIN